MSDSLAISCSVYKDKRPRKQHILQMVRKLYHWGQRPPTGRRFVSFKEQKATRALVKLLSHHVLTVIAACYTEVNSATLCILLR